jgi:hypothetical protein
MDDRRKALRITWVDVARTAGMGDRTLYNVRTGISGGDDSTRAGIEDALRWARGSIQAILDGGEPAPLPARTPAEGEWLPPLSESQLAAARPFVDAIYARLIELAGQGIAKPSGRQVFPDSAQDAGDWDRRADLYSVHELVWMIADAKRREAAADERRAGAGLARPGLVRS